MQVKEKVAVFWFRRDLRLEDNKGLSEALNTGLPVLPLFIFDSNIIDELPQNDARITLIYKRLKVIHKELQSHGSSLVCKKGNPINVWKELLTTYTISKVFCNEDYEPYAINRDRDINELLSSHQIEFFQFKDQVIFAKNDILKNDGKPYTVYTPYKNKWLTHLTAEDTRTYNSQQLDKFLKIEFDFPSIHALEFEISTNDIKPFHLNDLSNYEADRNFPARDNTTYLSPYLRFGLVSIRQLVRAYKQHQTFINELIWREFFMQILYHFPNVIHHNFRRKYDGIQWRNNKNEFEKWKNGQTGYPMVDAGIRELNATGYMHNRVRMVVASFLCKHLLIDWRWGEAYFAEKLLDFELSSNNGNWQWAAGTGCDAAPYFRVFNPTEQIKKFDKDLKYIQKWIPELNTLKYPAPMVEHKIARERALKTYKNGIQN